MNAPAYLASCAACGATAADGGGATTYACDVPQADPFHCPKCRPGLIPADELAQPNEVVGLVDARREARWVVLARDGGTVTIRPLGFPRWPSREVSLGEIRPKFSYERLAAARRR
jgi:hypothetical protein